MMPTFICVANLQNIYCKVITEVFYKKFNNPFRNDSNSLPPSSISSFPVKGLVQLVGLRQD